MTAADERALIRALAAWDLDGFDGLAGTAADWTRFKALAERHGLDAEAIRDADLADRWDEAYRQIDAPPLRRFIAKAARA